MYIKDLLETSDYVIILDTNVLLNIYRFSPDFSVFALNCLRTVSQYIVLPATVHLEFCKHNRAEFNKMTNRVREAGTETKDQISRAKEKIISSCKNFDRLKFPDTDELKSALSKNLNDLEKSFDDFFVDHNILEFISDPWEGVDQLSEFVNDLGKSNLVMKAPSQLNLYNWCSEGEMRYKKQIPPGFKDAKNKDGLRKYSDLILWKEIIRYATEKKVNVIFVTDDVKADWWENSDGELTFHDKLIQEFNKTGQSILPCTSSDFYKKISTDYDIPINDAVDIALNISDEEYIEKVKDDIFSEIEYKIWYSNTDYIDISSSHIGTEGIEELQIDNYELKSAERVDRDDDIVTYNFKFFVTVSGRSYDYWGRDDDTHEVITSPGRDHEFEGEFIIEVKREADVFLDYTCDISFISAEILYGDLKETSYDDVNEYYYEEPGEFGYCPDCGCPLNIDNDGGNGFCNKCAWNH